MHPDELLKRIVRLRLQKKELGRLAGVHETTVANVLSGRRGRIDTYRALERAVVSEELAVRDALLALHPVEPEARAA